jgi:rhodanese-related sulfurtransferase
MPNTTIDCLTLRELLDSADPPRLIDVRTPGEFQSVHIDGSYNVPLDILDEHRGEIAGNLGQHVVLICRSGQRAGQAGQALVGAGLTNVHILEGGISGWEGHGFRLNRGAQRWDLERQVRLVAGLIVAVSVLVGMFVPGVEWIAFGIGVGLTVAALTNSCAMGMLLARLPYNQAGVVCDASMIVDQLVKPRTR